MLLIKAELVAVIKLGKSMTAIILCYSNLLLCLMKLGSLCLVLLELLLTVSLGEKSALHG